MEGKFTKSGKNYEWWAGRANPEADEDYCVHCRRGDWGVTQYLATEPSQKEAEELANGLTTQVENVQI